MTYRHPFPVLGLTVGMLLSVSGCSDDATGPELTDPRLFITASAGSQHTCAITVDDRLLCWGRNYYGQIGDGTDVSRDVPTPALTSLPFSVVSAGTSHTCGLTSEGVAYCWGLNDLGQLGIGSEEHRRTEPALVNTASRFTSISAGRRHTCAIDTEGKAHCWGGSEYGAVGVQVAGEGCWAPCARSPAEMGGDLRFESVSAGWQHNCGITASGSIHCWGDNQYGQLGVSTSELCERGYDVPVPCSTTPASVSGGTSWKDVSAGSGYTCARSRDGRAHCWGSQWVGVLGDGSDPLVDDFRTEPAPVVGDRTFVGVWAGSSRTCAVSAQGPTYCWGSGWLGDESGARSSVPVQVATSALFTMVSVGGSHTCGVSREGVMYCWGQNQHGQLGAGSYALGWPTPVVVRGW